MRLLPLLLTLLALSFTNAHAKDTVEGFWLTENKRAVVKIEPCEQSVCGSVYWIIEGGLTLDQFNPDIRLRKRAICGMTILSDFEKEGENDWEDGRIYKADDGDTYNADIELLEDGTLKVRGYLGLSFLGKTQIWTRADQKDYKQCVTPKT